jgi:hypothetical protein
MLDTLRKFAKYKSMMNQLILVLYTMVVFGFAFCLFVNHEYLSNHSGL